MTTPTPLSQDEMRDRVVIVSADGHATTPVAGFEKYLESRFVDEQMRAWLSAQAESGSRQYELASVESRSGSAIAQDWQRRVLEPGRHAGASDPVARLRALDAEGIAAEVLFPEFGFPLEGRSNDPSRPVPALPEEHRQAVFRGYNRWLADFVSVAPHRFAGMAAVRWTDPQAAIRDIADAIASGMRGIVLPKFDRARPLYHLDFEPVWAAVEEMGVVVNLHPGTSAVTEEPIAPAASPHPGTTFRLASIRFFRDCREILAHLIWGGVLERHPRLQVVVSEAGSGWIPAYLAEDDHAYSRSMIRPDIREFLSLTPSEYFARHCHIGSSIFSLAEIEARHTIGVDKMMIGLDYPHQESTLLEGTRTYLRATFGQAGVPVDEAKTMLGQTAARLFGLDLQRLEPHAVTTDEILTPLDINPYIRGDLFKPLAGSL